MLRFLTGWLTILTLCCLWAMPTEAQQVTPPSSVTVKGPNASVRSDPYTPHIPARAFAYIRTQRTLGLTGMAWSLLGLWIFARSGVSVRLRNAVYRLTRDPVPEDGSFPKFRDLLVFYLFYTLFLVLWNLPFGAAELAAEWRYGFSHESFAMYMSDVAKTWAMGLLGVPVLSGVYWLVNRSPQRWWLWLWGLTLPLSIAIMVVEPESRVLFNRYVPLAKGPLRTQIVALAKRAGMPPNANVLIEDTSRRTTHVNAYVTGIGPSARIVINDTAIQTLPEDQLLAMVGHEMGHYVERHIWIGLLSGALGSGAFYFLAFRLMPVLNRRIRQSKTGLRGPMDLAALPLLFFYFHLALLIQDPILGLESRYIEHRADAFGLRVTGLHTATARLMVSFAERDFTDPDPPALLHFWFGTHPTVKERIAFALSGQVQPSIPPRPHP